MITTKQKLTIDTKKIMREACKYNTEDKSSNCKGRKNDSKQRGTPKKQKTTKIAVNKCLSIITLNVTGLNSPIKGQSSSMHKRTKTHLYAAYKRLTSDIRTHTD